MSDESLLKLKENKDTLIRLLQLPRNKRSY